MTDDRRPTADKRRLTTDHDPSPFVPCPEHSRRVRPSSSIELHIERLVLHDIAAGDASTVRAVVERELARLFAESGVPDRLARGGARARLNGGAFDVAPRDGIDAIGAQVARAVYDGLNAEF
jgi:hypothetical protein